MPEGGVWDTIKPYLLGSLSGSLASAVIQPIDTTKVNIQNRREAAGKTKVNLNPIAVAKDIIAESGVKGLYRGVDSAILRQLVYAGIRLGIYRSLEDSIKHKEGRNLSFGEKITISLASGAIGSAIANPTDVSLIRFQSDHSLPKEERRNYKNVFDALKRITQEQGVRGLWRGSIPTIARAMAVNSSHLVSYGEAKEKILQNSKQKTETISIRLLASAISGVSVACISLPFDNVKTKIMKMKASSTGELPYAGFIDCFRKSIQREGVSGLWVGLPTYYTRIAPHAMITVLAQDFLHDLFSPKKKQ